MINLTFFFFLTIVFSSLLTVTATNPVFGSLHLIFTYVLISLFLLLHEAEFFTTAYIIICAGGMGILFLFVVMTLPIIKVKEKLPKLAFFVFPFFILFIIELVPLLGDLDLAHFFENHNVLSDNYIYTETHGTNITEIGKYLYLYYPLAVILCGILLFIALIGAIFLTARTDTKK